MSRGGLCQVIYSYEVIGWDRITWDTWGRDVLRSVGFYIKCTQSRSTSTFKIKFSKQIHHIPIDFYFHLSQETEGDIWLLNDCHGTLSVPCGSDPLQMSCFLGMVTGRWSMCTPFPIFHLQTSCFFLRACRTHFPCFFFHRSVSPNLLNRTQKLLRIAVDNCTFLNW